MPRNKLSPPGFGCCGDHDTFPTARRSTSSQVTRLIDQPPEGRSFVDKKGRLRFVADVSDQYYAPYTQLGVAYTGGDVMLRSRPEIVHPLFHLLDKATNGAFCLDDFMRDEGYSRTEWKYDGCNGCWSRDWEDPLGEGEVESRLITGSGKDWTVETARWAKNAAQQKIEVENATPTSSSACASPVAPVTPHSPDAASSSGPEPGNVIFAPRTPDFFSTASSSTAAQTPPRTTRSPSLASTATLGNDFALRSPDVGMGEWDFMSDAGPGEPTSPTATLSVRSLPESPGGE